MNLAEIGYRNILNATHIRRTASVHEFISGNP